MQLVLWMCGVYISLVCSYTVFYVYLSALFALFPAGLPAYGSNYSHATCPAASLVLKMPRRFEPSAISPSPPRLILFYSPLA